MAKVRVAAGSWLAAKGATLPTALPAGRFSATLNAGLESVGARATYSTLRVTKPYELIGVGGSWSETLIVRRYAGRSDRKIGSK